MRLKSITVKHFKRFTDLTVSSIPSEARLLISQTEWLRQILFLLTRYMSGINRTAIEESTGKTTITGKIAPQVPLPYQGNEITVDFHQPIPTDLDARKKMFYIRSAYRNEADFNVNRIGKARKSTRRIGLFSDKLMTISRSVGITNVLSVKALSTCMAALRAAPPLRSTRSRRQSGRRTPQGSAP